MHKTAGMTLLLRLEGLALGLLCVWMYYLFDQPWWIFAVLFLTPDLSMLGYLAGPRIGALAYNAAHSWVSVVLLFAIAWFEFDGEDFVLSLVFILGAHVGIDRALGYGLKYESGFKDTHLGRIGAGN